jgi:hypothetical protein
MAVARRAAGTPVNGNVTTLTPAYPTNAVDDILILHHVSAGSSPSAPTGWTLLGKSTTSGSAVTNVFWRRVTTVLTGTETVTISPNAQSWAAITSYSGVRTSGNPHSTVNITGGTGGGTALSAGPINALANSTSSTCFVVACIGANGARSFTSEALSGLTSVTGSEGYDANVGAGNSIMLWSASGTGTTNSTTSTTLTATMSSSDTASAVLFDLVAEPTTRMYPTTGTPGYTPTTLRGSWSATASAIAIPLGFTKSGTLTTQGISTAQAGTYSQLFYRAITPPLQAVNITSSLSFVLSGLQNDGTGGVRSKIHIFATQGDSDIVRGTILTANVAGTVWPNNAAGVGLLNTAIDGDLTLLDGDRIVIEWGEQQAAPDNDPITSTTTYGGTAADLVLTTQSTTASGWVEFMSSVPLSLYSPTPIAAPWLTA